MKEKYIPISFTILAVTACLIYALGLTAGLALVSSVGLAYLFIGVCRALQTGRDILWAVVDIAISLGLGFTGTLMAGLTIGGSTGLLAGLLVSTYLACNVKGKYTISQLLLGVFRRKPRTYAMTVWPGPDD